MRNKYKQKKRSTEKIAKEKKNLEDVSADILNFTQNKLSTDIKMKNNNILKGNKGTNDNKEILKEIKKVNLANEKEFNNTLYNKKNIPFNNYTLGATLYNLKNRKLINDSDGKNFWNKCNLKLNNGKKENKLIIGLDESSIRQKKEKVINKK